MLHQCGHTRIVLGALFSLLIATLIHSAAAFDYCTTQYPIAGYPVWDFDANCNWASNVWTSKISSGHTSSTASFTPARRVYDETRDNYRLSFVTGGDKLELPAIPQTTYPSIAAEFLVSIYSLENTGSWRSLWSTAPSAYSGVNATYRSFLTYHPALSGNNYLMGGKVSILVFNMLSKRRSNIKFFL
ncbi:hypothetical protein DFS34DRAFT_173524 [Phlyctochytrium arcticum]|nr:hypothetical protein DFS34DRAFT_173524 [Phlyctochytrium arcticum]